MLVPLDPSAAENLASYIFLVKAVAPFLLLPSLAFIPVIQLEAPEGEFTPRHRGRAHTVGVDGIQGADGDGVAVHQGLAVRAAARVGLCVAGVGAAAGGPVDHLDRFVQVVVVVSRAGLSLTAVHALHRVGTHLTWDQEVPRVIAVSYYHLPLDRGGTWGSVLQHGTMGVDGSGCQLAENERIRIGAVPHVVVVVWFGEMGRRAVRGDRGVATVVVRLGRRRHIGSVRRDNSRTFAEAMPAVVPTRARVTVAVCHLGVTEGAGAVVEAADHRAGALATGAAPQRTLVSTLEDLVQQRAVERHAAVERTPVGQNLGVCKLVTHIEFVGHWRLISASVTQHTLLLLLLLPI